MSQSMHEERISRLIIQAFLYVLSKQRKNVKQLQEISLYVTLYVLYIPAIPITSHRQNFIIKPQGERVRLFSPTSFLQVQHSTVSVREENFNSNANIIRITSPSCHEWSKCTLTQIRMEYPSISIVNEQQNRYYAQQSQILAKTTTVFEIPSAVVFTS